MQSGRPACRHERAPFTIARAEEVWRMTAKALYRNLRRARDPQLDFAVHRFSLIPTSGRPQANTQIVRSHLKILRSAWRGIGGSLAPLCRRLLMRSRLL